MPNKDLVNYITAAVAQHIPREQIKQTLLGVGWKEADVETALSSVMGDGAVNTATPVSSQATPASPQGSFGSNFPEHPDFVSPDQNPMIVNPIAGGGPNVAVAGQRGSGMDNLVHSKSHHPMLVRFVVASVIILLAVGGFVIWKMVNKPVEGVPEGTILKNVEPALAIIPEKSVEAKLQAQATTTASVATTTKPKVITKTTYNKTAQPMISKQAIVFDRNGIEKDLNLMIDQRRSQNLITELNGYYAEVCNDRNKNTKDCVLTSFLISAVKANCPDPADTGKLKICLPVVVNTLEKMVNDYNSSI